MHSGVDYAYFRIFILMGKYIRLIILFISLVPFQVEARRHTPKDDIRDSVLLRVFSYSHTVDTVGLVGNTSYTYTKFHIRTNRRNATLMLVPTMYAVSHGTGRQFIGEYYGKTTITSKLAMQTNRLLNINTIPHRRNTMSTVLNYLTPNIYGERLFQENILSPFHRKNKRFYSYFVTPLPFGKAQVYAYPKLKNTQLVQARSIVDMTSGRVDLVDFEGEYDMVRFYISVVMGKEGFRSLMPQQCNLKANFRFMGNKLTAMYTSVYDLPKVISDSLANSEDTVLMNKVRPIKLNESEQQFFERYFRNKSMRDSLQANSTKKKNFAKDFLWDVIGDNVLNRVQQDFGKNNQGYFRLSPILNPLYMGYSHRKGFVYKFDVRGFYAFNEDCQLWLRFRAGYSFKQKRLYFSVPATFNFNQKHDGFLQMEFGKGNRINSNLVSRRILGVSEKNDSLNLALGNNYTEFKDDYFRMTAHWMFNPYIGMELGFISHHRTAVRPDFYISNHYPGSYRSVAPALAIEWHPLGAKGPVVKMDYERSVNGLFNSNIAYERVELDAQTILYASRRRSYSLRAGSGFYTMRGDHWYFVDYTNFRDNNIPGGWNDDWSGEFELLNSGWYNASEFYFRSNATYEAPIFFAAWLPLLGRYIEKERLYVNTLFVRHLYPYTEWGYGFSTRLFSIGIFSAFKNARFNGFGCKFGIELFRDW